MRRYLTVGLTGMRVRWAGEVGATESVFGDFGCVCGRRIIVWDFLRILVRCSHRISDPSSSQTKFARLRQQFILQTRSKLALIAPRTLLRLDAVGAFLTAAVAGLAAARPDWFGMPVYHMGIMCAYALGLVLYGLYFSREAHAEHAFHLRRVAKANLLFVGLLGVLVLRYWGGLTDLARVYFAAELAVVGALVWWEFRVVERAG